MMLPLPQRGFSQSVNVNNINREALGDWLEASALFGDDQFSMTDVADILVEQGVVSTPDYQDEEVEDDDQDLANRIAMEGWVELRNRLKSSGAARNFQVDNDVVKTTGCWTTDPVRSFLVLLSLNPLYTNWAAACREIGDQGLLFERVSANACERIFEGWHVYRAGWSAEGAKSIPHIVADLSDLLGVRGSTNLEDWVGRSAKDAGLDLLCFRQFPDRQECVPYLAIQCASGHNWTSKLQQPSTNTWQGLLGAMYQPMRGLTIPFVVDDLKRKQSCGQIEGPLFDRNRLLSAGSHIDEWMPDMADELIDWCRPRIDLLRRS